MIKNLYKKLVSEKYRIDLIHLWSRLTAWKYRGIQVECNCCNKSFRCFLPFGNPPRANAVCPFCLSLERTRTLKLFLEKYFDNVEAVDVLHFAPERALVDFMRENSKSYISADISKEVADTVVDITKMQFEDNQFDLIICSHVLAHVKEESIAIDEIQRVLKPGGQALILTALTKNEHTIEDLTAITPEQKLKRLGQDDIWRKHGQDFLQRLKREGLEVTRLDIRQNMDEEKIKYYGLGDSSREVFYILEKKV